MTDDEPEDAAAKLARLLRAAHPDDRTWSDDPEERALLAGALAKCHAYLTSQTWCFSVKRALLAYGVPGVLSVFLVEVEGKPEVDAWLWCVVGDCPSAYLVLDATDTPAEALELYAGLMEDWANCVLGEHDDDVYPVEATWTEENARSLLVRIALIRDDLIPDCEAAYEERMGAVGDLEPAG